MRYIALEEAFSIPELEARQPALPDRGRFKPEYEDAWSRKLADFTEFRLPEMGATGIDMQVLSLTVPGLQATSRLASLQTTRGSPTITWPASSLSTRRASRPSPPCRCRIRQPRSPSWTAASASSVSVAL